MNEKEIYDIIKQLNLYPQNRTYVQPFTDGSYMFWNKIPSFTQYINDVNHRLFDFYKSLRNGKIIKNSIYCQHQPFTKSIQEIINSNFYKRLDQTYLFDRDYKSVLKATDDPYTFFYIQIQNLTKEIFDSLSNIKGKYLIVCNHIFDRQYVCNNSKIESKKNKNNQLLYFIYNYQKNQNNQDLFL